MLRGGHPGERNSVKEYLAFKSVQHQKDIEEARFIVLVRALGLNRTDQTDVDSFKDLLELYRRTMDPSLEDTKKKSYEDKVNLLEGFKKAFPTINTSKKPKAL